MEKKEIKLNFKTFSVIAILILLPGIALGGAMNEFICHPLIEIPSSFETTITTADEIFQFLRDTFSGHVQVTEYDRTYYLPNLSHFKEFLKADNLDKYKYNKECPGRFDCDDYGWILKGRAAEKGIPLAVVVLSQWQEGKAHMLNLFLTVEEGELKGYLIEPQTDDVLDINDELRNKVSYVLI